MFDKIIDNKRLRFYIAPVLKLRGQISGIRYGVGKWSREME
jgi:hypothetical protein